MNLTDVCNTAVPGGQAGFMRMLYDSAGETTVTLYAESCRETKGRFTNLLLQHRIAEKLRPARRNALPVLIPAATASSEINFRTGLRASSLLG